VNAIVRLGTLVALAAAMMASAQTDPLESDKVRVLATTTAKPTRLLKLAQTGFEVWPSQTPQEFTKYMSDQLAHWTSLIEQAGIQPE
jgi:tripartite-type tricarboxylate transporter receptor subunit TctC